MKNETVWIEKLIQDRPALLYLVLSKLITKQPHICVHSQKESQSFGQFVSVTNFHAVTLVNYRTSEIFAATARTACKIGPQLPKHRTNEYFKH